MRLLWGLVAAALLCSLGAGCGGPSAAKRAEERQVNLALITPELKDRLAKQAAEVKSACQAQAGGFFNAISDLDSRLDVGLTYSDYTSDVANVKVQYDRLTPANLTGACLTAAADDEKALNAYLRATTIWQNCIDDTYCTNDSIKSKLQAQWLIATDNDAKAKAILARMAGGTALAVGSHRFPASDGDVDNTIYGTIRKTICTSVPDPPAATKPCIDLRNTLAGGVAENEQSAVDKEIGALVKALGLSGQ
jgi:hypothetical protein